MKNINNIYYVGIILLIVGLTGLYYKAYDDLEEYKAQVAIEKWETEKRIEQMEKEIRILKTDSYINTNGFEGGQE